VRLQPLGHLSGRVWIFSLSNTLDRLLMLFSIAAATTASAQEVVKYGCSTTVTYRFGPGVPSQQHDLIQEALGRAVNYICRKTGYGTSDFIVVASPVAADLIRAEVDLGYPLSSASADFAGGSGCATSPLGGILIYTANALCWQWDQPNVQLNIGKILAHEYFHQVQRRLANITSPNEIVDADQVSVKGPAWLIEGSAEMVGWMADDDGGLRGYSDSIRCSGHRRGPLLILFTGKSTGHLGASPICA
jgi:hypothetical protein